MTVAQEKDEIDILIVGGGIVGVGILRDLALHGMDVVLIDKGDFSSQTSQSSSKMLHGGIRYLENADFALVHEALHEKNLWLKLAPHLCQEEAFCLPVFKESKYPLFMLRIGLFLYDLLSGFQNMPHRVQGKKQTSTMFPQLKTKGLRGSGVYYDAIVDDAKLALECLYDALEEKNARAYNYVELQEYQPYQHHAECKVLDLLTQEKKTLKAKHIIFATGPFTDQLFQKLKIKNWSPKLIPSKGIHLWLKRSALELAESMVLQTKDDRIIFVIPQENAILVGTTETEVKEEIFNIKAQKEEVDYLLGTLCQYFPKANLSPDDILSTFAGVRPLVTDGSQNRSKTSREHQLYQINSYTHIIMGGKYTTFRIMAQDICQKILDQFQKPYYPHYSCRALRVKSIIPFQYKGNFTQKQVQDIIQNEYPRTFEDLLVRRMGIPNKNHWRQSENFDEFFESTRKLFDSSCETCDPQPGSREQLSELS